MIKEIQAKTMLSRVKGEDDWFGLVRTTYSYPR